MAFRLNLRRMRSKRFYFHLYTVFASVTILISSLFMWGVYWSAREDLLESERRLSADLLTQVRYNLVTIDAMHRNLCFSVLNSNEAQSLLYNTHEDSYALMLMRNRLSDNLRSNPFVHSVYLYNSAKNTYYSTHKSFHYVDDDFLAQIESGALRPNLKPLVRDLDGNIVLTYGLGELFGRSTRDVAVYVNVYLDYVIENLEEFSSGELLAFDQSGKPLNRFVQRAGVSDALLGKLSDALPDGADALEAQILLVSAPGEEPQSATVLFCPQMDWMLVKLQPYNEAFTRTERLRATIIALNISVLLLISVLYALISRQMYKPIKRMLNQVSGTASSDILEDEFAYLTRFYRDMRAELSELRQARENRMQLTDFSLQKLLQESRLLSWEEICALVREYGLPLDLTKPMRLLMFIADDFALLPPEFAPESERPLVLFGMRNLLDEAFEPLKNYALTYTENAYLALLVNAEDDEAELLLQRAWAFKSSVLSYFNLPVAVSVSRRIGRAQDISDTYIGARTRLADRFIHGKDCILEPNAQEAQPAATELMERMQRLKGCIESGNATDAEHEAAALFDEFAKLDCAGAVTQIIRLQQILHDAFMAVNAQREDPIDFSELVRDIAGIQARTLAEYRAQVLGAVGELRHPGATPMPRAQTLAEGIRDAIERDYGNCALCATAIADRLGVTSAHAGRVFKQHTGMSIPEYINQVRLSKAALWLENSDLTVSEIMLRVGYMNESYFFKLFKARYGVTPRNYKGKGEPSS